MLTNYLKIAWRNLLRNKVYSFINIGGLALGMAVAMLIGLWVWDEVSVNRSFANYDRIAQVWQHQTFNGKIGTQEEMPPPLGNALRTNYGTGPDGGPFKRVVMTTSTFPSVMITWRKEADRNRTHCRSWLSRVVQPDDAARNPNGPDGS